MVHRVAQLGDRSKLSKEDLERYERVEKRREEEARQVARAGRRAKSKVPSDYAQAMIGDSSFLEEVPAKYAAVCSKLKAAMQSPITVVLLGHYRVGKTEMACGLVNAFCDAGRSSRYCTVFDLFLEVSSTRSLACKETLLDCIDRFKAYDLLVLDEITVRTDSSFDDIYVRNLVDHRLNNGKSTLIIGNLAAEKVVEHLGEAVVARISQSGGIYPLPWKTLKYKKRPTTLKTA